MFITNGAQADWVCLLARTSPDRDDGRGYRGMSLIMVPRIHPIHRQQKLKAGNHSSDTAVLTFENACAAVDRIGAEGMGFYLQMEVQRTLVAATAGVSGMGNGVRQTIQYSSGSQHVWKAAISNQWIQFKLCELLTEIEALRQLNYSCAAMMDDDDSSVEVTKIASMCKLKVGRLMREVADTCIQFYGGMGYMEETPISRYFRDARLTSIGGGTDEVMLGIIAKLEIWKRKNRIEPQRRRN
jgi:citronellyl-CoA dehydrogenase